MDAQDQTIQRCRTLCIIVDTMRLSAGWVRKMQGVFDPSICGMSTERRMFSKLGFGDIVEKKNSFALLLVA